MKQLEEEALMEQCIEAMLEDELENKVPLWVSFTQLIYVYDSKYWSVILI